MTLMAHILVLPAEAGTSQYKFLMDSTP